MVAILCELLQDQLRLDARHSIVPYTVSSLTRITIIKHSRISSFLLQYIYTIQIKQKEKEIRLLILGLDNAGKTTVLRKFCGEPIDTIEPTLGFNIQTLEYRLKRQSNGHDDNNASTDNVEAIQESSSSPNTPVGGNNPTYLLHFWDVGGQKSIRAYWRNYFEQTDGLIWVVDSADRVRLDLCRQELAKLLQQERLAGASLLILANKQDVDGALSASEIAQVLELETSDRYQNRHSCIVPCSAVTGKGLEKGMEWIVGDISNRIFMLS